MTGTSQNDIDAAASEAADWLIALQEDPDNRQLRAEFERWHAESSLNAEAWAGLGRIDGLIGAAGPSGASRAGAARAPRSVRRAVAGIGALAIAACLVLFYVPTIFLALTADYLTGRAGVREVILSDGTHVHLGAESAISVDYDEGGRRVDLLAGHAYFDVTRDESRPFRVASGSAETIVLGTAFEIKRSDGANFVAVREGSVRVRSPGRGNAAHDDQLRPGDTLRVTAAGNRERGHVDPGEVAAWLEGALIVRDRPVGEVVETLKSYSESIILIAGADLAEKRITGVYDLSDPDEALRAIARAHNVHVRQVTPWIILLSTL